MVLKGINASDGVGLGCAVCVREESLDYSDVPYSGKEAEKARLQNAIDEFNQRTAAMADRIREQTGPKEAEILTGQITMLADPFMLSQMQEAIRFMMLLALMVFSPKMMVTVLSYLPISATKSWAGRMCRPWGLMTLTVLDTIMNTSFQICLLSHTVEHSI